MTTSQQIIDRIKFRTGMNVDDTSPDTAILAELNGQQERLESEGVNGEMPWFLFVDSRQSVLHLTIDASDLRKSTTGTWIDLMRLFDVNPVRVQTSSQVMGTPPEDATFPLFTPLAGRGFDEFDSLDGGDTAQTTGFPTHYTIFRASDTPQLTVKVYPVPYGQTLNYSIRGFRREATLDLGSNLENGWTKHAGDLLLATTGIEVAQTRGNAPALQYFTSIHGRAMDALWRSSVAFYEAILQDDALDDQVP